MRRLPRFIAFVAAGLANTAFGYGLYSGLVWSGMQPQLAVVVATCVGVAFNFVTYGHVFRAMVLANLPRFAVFYAAQLTVNLAALHTLHEVFGLGAYLSQALVVIALVPVAFVILRRFVFVVRATGEEVP